MNEGHGRGWIRGLLPFLANHRRNVAWAFGAAVVGMVIQALTPVVEKVIVDDVVLSHRRPLGPWLGLLLGAGVVSFGAAYIRRFRGGRVALDVQFDLRTAVFERLQRLDFARHDQLDTGQLVSRASSDLGLIQGLLSFLPIVSGNVVMLVVSLVVMLFLSPPLTLVALVAIPTIGVVAWRLRTAVFPASWDAQQRAAEVTGVVDEAVTGVRVVKGFGQERREVGRLTGVAERLFGSRVRTVRLQARLQSALQAVPALAQVAILGFGGWLAYQGDITLGTFLAFSTYLLQLVAPVRMLAGLLSFGQQARAGAERILELLDSDPTVTERDDARTLRQVGGEVSFDDVSFGYMRSRPVLSGFSLCVRPGETVALVGASGSGKSTVALLLPRFYDVDGGAVRVDGVDVRDVTFESLRRQIGVVFEETFLFSDTVRANIAYGRPDSTDAQILEAARAAEADRFITELPDGYDTVVGERGLTLSGGQRQRVTLARALVTDPTIIVLDDATSAVDPTVEAEIHATLRRLMADRTTIIVAHRRSTISLADRIVVVDGGRVLAEGTHDDLMASCPRYVELLTGAAPEGEPLTAPPTAGEATTRSENGHRVVEHPAATLTGQRGVAAAARAASWVGRPGPPSGHAQGGHFALVGALPADEKLLAQVAALPPADDAPGVDPAVAARPDPQFSLGRFVRPFRGALAVGVALVAIDALAGLTGPALVRAGVAQGVARHSNAGLIAATAAFALTVLVDWWALWAAARWTGRLSERLLYSLRVKVFAHLSRLGLDFYERELGGRILTRMTSHIE